MYCIVKRNQDEMESCEVVSKIRLFSKGPYCYPTAVLDCFSCDRIPEYVDEVEDALFFENRNDAYALLAFFSLADAHMAYDPDFLDVICVD